jgi:hypothetical protein
VVLPPSHCSALWLQKRAEQADGTTTKTVEEKTDSFASWQEATSCSLAGVSMKRLSKLYLLVRGGCPLGVRGDWPEPVL